MAFLQARRLDLHFGERALLEEVDFTLGPGQRTALAGANGSGKTTFLRILAGDLSPDGGTVSLSHGATLGYLPQSGRPLGTGSVVEEALRAYAWAEPWLAEIGALETQLAEAPEAPETPARLERLHALQEDLERRGWHQRRARTETTLKGLGFVQSDLDRPAQTLSGGWQLRVGLAQVLLEQPDLLLLDEPTNYLDWESIQWLKGFLRTYPGGLVVVSHDRDFLDATVSEVAELFLARLKLYKGNYSTYERLRRQEVERLQAAYAVQQAQIAKTEEFIDRFRAKATKAAQVQSRIKELERLERIELPEHLKPLRFQFPPAPPSGDQVLQGRGLTQAYGAQTVFKGLDLDLHRGDKLVLAGPNGAGKSTLMRLLAGRSLPKEGSVRLGTGVKAAYFSQDYEKDLVPSRTVLEEAETLCPTEFIPQLRNLLGAFLFRGDDVFKKVGVLSGGEKNRLSLVKLLLQRANLLLLDEPTNHLDLASKEVLLEALRQFEGTVVFVSHDTHFLEGLGNKVLALGEGAPRLYPGSFGEYRSRLEAAQGASESAALGGGSRGADRPNAPVSSAPATASAQARQANKQTQALRRRLERERDEVLARLTALEAEAKSLHQDLASPEVYTDGARVKTLQARLAENETAQGVALGRWEALETELAGLD